MPSLYLGGTCHPVLAAQPGWQGIPWGASAEQIEAQSTHPVEKKSGRSTAPGGKIVTYYEIRPYVIDGDSYAVTLWMSDPDLRLTSVIIRPLEHNLDDYALKARAVKLERLLTVRYGAPQLNRNERDILGTEMERIWKTPDTTVRLFGMFGMPAFLSIRYDAPGTSEASKL